MAKPKKYYYSIMHLKDAQPTYEVFVPNCTPAEAIDIFRYLSGHRKDFPKFKDGSNIVTGIDEDAWCSPKVYREAYAPPEMTCIARWPS